MFEVLHHVGTPSGNALAPGAKVSADDLKGCDIQHLIAAGAIKAIGDTPLQRIGFQADHSTSPDQLTAEVESLHAKVLEADKALEAEQKAHEETKKKLAASEAARAELAGASRGEPEPHHKRSNR
jgi:hypothetical protein